VDQKFLDAHELQVEITRLQQLADKTRERVTKLETGIANGSSFINDEGEEVFEIPEESPEEDKLQFTPYAMGVVMSAFTIHLRLSRRLSPSTKTFLEKYGYRILPIVSV